MAERSDKGGVTVPATVAAKVDEVRAILLDLLRTDPEVRALLTPPPEMDAATGIWVMGLIVEKMRQHINPEYLRRPL